MSINKYIIYECSICKRQTQILLDGKRPDPIRCNITQSCRGILSKIGDISNRKTFFTPIVPGLIDFTPRGFPILDLETTVEANSIIISTAANNSVLTLALLQKETIGNDTTFFTFNQNNTRIDIETVINSNEPVNSIIKLALFEVTTDILQFKKYTYVITGNVQLIRGPDDSIDNKNLRFTQNNEIKVFVNGIELNSSEFDSSINDQIIFTPEIIDTNNVVEVLVFNNITTNITESDLIFLEFKPLKPNVLDELIIRNTACWGDIFDVEINSIERTLLFCTNTSVLNPTKTYGVSRLEVTSNLTNLTNTIKNSEAFILLGQEPYNFKDKFLHVYLNGDNLILNQAILIYKRSEATGQLEISTKETNLTNIFNPIKITNKVINSKLISSVNEETTNASTEISTNYILGPS